MRRFVFAKTFVAYLLPLGVRILIVGYLFVMAFKEILLANWVDRHPKGDTAINLTKPSVYGIVYEVELSFLNPLGY